MDIVPISDNHNHKLKLPDGDLLLHSGDLTMMGTAKEVIEGVKWLGEIKHKYKHGVVLVPGNHDFLFEDPNVASAKIKRGRDIERNPTLARQICEDNGIILLIDQSIEIEGIKIYGSPTQPWFHDWAFNVQRSEIAREWKKIPDDTQILISHGPPYGIGDLTRHGHVGCEALTERIKELSALKLHICGHIHEGAGTSFFNNKLMVNASVLDAWYNGFNPINVVEWPSLNVRRFPDESV